MRELPLNDGYSGLALGPPPPPYTSPSISGRTVDLKPVKVQEISFGTGPTTLPFCVPSRGLNPTTIKRFPESVGKRGSLGTKEVRTLLRHPLDTTKWTSRKLSRKRPSTWGHTETSWESQVRVYPD